MATPGLVGTRHLLLWASCPVLIPVPVPVPAPWWLPYKSPAPGPAHSCPAAYTEMSMWLVLLFLGVAGTGDEGCGWDMAAKPPDMRQACNSCRATAEPAASLGPQGHPGDLLPGTSPILHPHAPHSLSVGAAVGTHLVICPCPGLSQPTGSMRLPCL